MKKIGSNRSFGIVFSIFLLIVGLWPLLNENNPRVWALVISLIFLILGLFNSKLLGPLNRLWIKFGELLGRIISPIVMGIVYFFVVTPIGLVMRLFKKDLLNLKFSKKNTYWIKREKNIGPMKRQF
tara:strand:- start:3849 stop:4226 length:378 start_codon:yes stop_codon:yes gene_type:complete